MRNTAISYGWRNPQFRDYDGFMKRICDCRQGRIEPLEHKGVQIDGEFAIVDKDSGQYYGHCKDRYVMVQNDQLLIPLAMALDKSNIPYSGSVKESNGVMVADLLIGQPYALQDSPYAVHVTVINSYTTKIAFRGEISPMRLTCYNGMMGANGLCEMLRAKHIEGITDTVDAWLRLFDQSQSMFGGLSKVIDQGRNQQLTAGDLERVLRAIGIGSKTATYMLDNARRLCPEVNSEGYNGWTGYNIGTALFNHREQGTYANNIEGLKTMAKILVPNLRPLIELGESIIEAENTKPLATV
jgi:hypothetical protein